MGNEGCDLVDEADMVGVITIQCIKQRTMIPEPCRCSQTLLILEVMSDRIHLTTASNPPY